MGTFILKQKMIHLKHFLTLYGDHVNIFLDLRFTTQFAFLKNYLIQAMTLSNSNLSYSL